MLYVAHHVECPFLGKLSVPLDVEGTLLRTVGCICECIGGASDWLHLDALAVLDVYGSTAIYRCRVRQRQSVQLNCCFIRP